MNPLTLKALAAVVLVAGAVGLVQEVRISWLQTENTRLQGLVKEHNDATEKLKLAGDLETSQATGRVADVLLKAEEQKRALPKGTGPAVMNEYMRVVFQ